MELQAIGMEKGKGKHFARHPVVLQVVAWSLLPGSLVEASESGNMGKNVKEIGRHFQQMKNGRQGERGN